MQQRNIRWLYRELPEWVAKDLISAETAETIQEHYGPVRDVSPSKMALILFGILGAALLGSGIILIFAHNWTSLGRPTRAFLSILPLLIGQCLVGWTVFRKADSRAWSEGSGLFLGLAIGASIALIGQTYHLPEDMDGFLLTWILLALPLVYILGSTAVAACYMVGATAWATAAQGSGGQALLYWALLGAVLPYLWKLHRDGEGQSRSTFLRWVLGLNLCVGVGVAMDRVVPGLWIPTYTSLFAVFTLAGITRHEEGGGRPFFTMGTIGTVVVATLLTFEWSWRRIGFNYYRTHHIHHSEWYAVLDFALVLALIAGVVLLSVGIVRRKDYLALIWVLAPLTAIISFFVGSMGDLEFIPVILFNLYLLVLGLVVLYQGLREERLLVANGGMAILSLLFLVRFFDGDMGILLRGIAFILIGGAFLGTNLWLTRNIAASTSEKLS